MIFFWPNFDVKKEQVSNTKREHGQTDAENPYKTATIARHRPELQHQKMQNECRISLKTKQHQDRTRQAFPNARRPEKDHRKPHQDNTHSEKEPTSGPLTMIGCRQDTSERPNSNSYPNRNRLHAIQRLRATWETANTPTSDPSRMKPTEIHIEDTRPSHGHC